MAIQRMLPTTRRPSEPPNSEPSIRRRVIGWIEERRRRGAAAALYFATGIHPEIGKEHRLEASTDYAERVEKVVSFDRDPTSSRQHLGIGHMPVLCPDGAS